MTPDDVAGWIAPAYPPACIVARVSRFTGCVAFELSGSAVICAVTWSGRPGIANLVLTGVILAIGAIAAIGFPWLKAPSRSGRRIMDSIEGFREYLSVAEEDRLDALNPPEKTPELFEKFLPYAVALDVSELWVRQFDGLLTEPPTWYAGSIHGFSSGGFHQSLASFQSAAATTLQSAPGGSSGSGGGGSVGGGGGGGGGGSW